MNHEEIEQLTSQISTTETQLAEARERLAATEEAFVEAQTDKAYRTVTDARAEVDRLTLTRSHLERRIAEIEAAEKAERTAAARARIAELFSTSSGPALFDAERQIAERIAAAEADLRSAVADAQALIRRQNAEVDEIEVLGREMGSASPVNRGELFRVDEYRMRNLAGYCIASRRSFDALAPSVAWWVDFNRLDQNAAEALLVFSQTHVREVRFVTDRMTMAEAVESALEGRLFPAWVEAGRRADAESERRAAEFRRHREAEREAEIAKAQKGALPFGPKEDEAA